MLQICSCDQWGYAAVNASALISERPYVEAARQCNTWINTARVVTEHGTYWRLSPDDDTPFGNPDQAWSLGMGATGIVLFKLELYAATGDETVLKEALAGADYVVAHLPFDEGYPDISLYYGVTGAAYMLKLTHQVSGQKKYREAALRCLTIIRRFVPTDPEKFFGQGNEIHQGRAGFGLTLLWLHKVTGNQEALELALLAGRTVLQRSRPHPKGGVYWYTGETAPEMIGFALGSAGMAYFLAMLYEHTGEKEYLDTAIAAARHIQSLAFEYGNGCLIDPAIAYTRHDGDDIRSLWGMYIGWYRGSTGIWRLFYQLWRITKDPEWVEWIHRLARGSMSLFPVRGDGIYESTGTSEAGSAKIAQNFLELFIASDVPEYLTFAETITSNILLDAVVDQSGMRWVMFYREQYITRTCFINGAAGMGSWFLHHEGYQRRRPPLVTLTDTPFQPEFFSAAYAPQS